MPAREHSNKTDQGERGAGWKGKRNQQQSCKVAREWGEGRQKPGKERKAGQYLLSVRASLELRADLLQTADSGNARVGFVARKRSCGEKFGSALLVVCLGTAASNQRELDIHGLKLQSARGAPM